MRDCSKISLLLSKKFEDAYRLHISPVLKNQDQDHDNISEVSIIPDSKLEKELKLQKGLKEVHEVLNAMLHPNESPRANEARTSEVKPMKIRRTMAAPLILLPPPITGLKPSKSSERMAIARPAFPGLPQIKLSQLELSPPEHFGD